MNKTTGMDFIGLSSIYRMQNIPCLVFIAKDDEE